MGQPSALKPTSLKEFPITDEPEASLDRERVSEVSQREDKNSPIPFQSLINKLYISSSLRNPL